MENVKNISEKDIREYMEKYAKMPPTACLEKEQEVEVVEPVRKLEVTNVSHLMEYAKGVIVEFPEFAPNQPLVARVRRPSMLMLAKSGKIPNSLLSTANALFNGGSGALDNDDEELMQKMFDVMETLCRASLVSPSYDEILEAGMELTDEQLMAIFNYSQEGIKALDSFR